VRHRHPKYAGGTFANELSVSADLSEASLEQACIDIGGFTNDRGLKIAIRPVPSSSRGAEFEAERILKSTLQSDSVDKQHNALRSGGSSLRVKINHYLTDTDAWFIRTNCRRG